MRGEKARGDLHHFTVCRREYVSPLAAGDEHIHISPGVYANEMHT